MTGTMIAVWLYVVGTWVTASLIGYHTPSEEQNYETLQRVILASVFWPLAVAAGIGSALRSDGS
jgi:hypothetical protein